MLSLAELCTRGRGCELGRCRCDFGVTDPETGKWTRNVAPRTNQATALLATEPDNVSMHRDRYGTKADDWEGAHSSDNSIDSELSDQTWEKDRRWEAPIRSHDPDNLHSFFDGRQRKENGSFIVVLSTTIIPQNTRYQDSSSIRGSRTKLRVILYTDVLSIRCG